MKHSFAKYILRIDDVCPTMKWDAFEQIQRACSDLSIMPIIGVVPDNQDEKLMVDAPRPDFWEVITSLSGSGWIIAQHGYQHIYDSSKSEFRGLSYQDQYEKIKTGNEILTRRLGFSPTWWMAPAHSFDDVTCAVLRDTGFNYITDGVALYPYKSQGLVWVPQQLWRPLTMPFGTWTICLHPNTMSQKEIDTLIAFLRSHVRQFQHVPLQPQQSLLNMPFRMAWNIIRSIH